MAPVIQAEAIIDSTTATSAASAASACWPPSSHQASARTTADTPATSQPTPGKCAVAAFIMAGL